MKKNKVSKIIFICLVSVLIVTALLILARKIFSKNELSGATFTVKKEIYENVIEVAGNISAAQEQTLQALSDGTVVTVNVKQGDFVRKGDLIIQLDDTEQQYNLARHDYDMETTKISGSDKELKLMETQRLSLLQKISDRKVIATFDGIIADIDVSVGDSLEAKDSVGTLVDVSYLTADVEIAETDVSKLTTNQIVEFTFPAYDGTVQGYVVGWPAIGEVTSRGSTIVKAQLRIDAPYPETILPNFSFSGKIKISPDENYLLVESNAVSRNNEGAFVEKVKGGEKIPVKVVPYDRDYVKIIEGNVSEGDVLKAQSVSKKSGKGNRRQGPPPGGF